MFPLTFRPKWVNKKFVLIRISRVKQQEKRGKIGRIIIPPNLIHMQYNQQVGEIMMYGEWIKEMMPDIEVGDELFFHHSVEGSIMSKEEAKKYVAANNWCVFDNEYSECPDDLYYMVREDFIYGMRKKETGEIIMHPDFCFAIASAEETNDRDVVMQNGLYHFVNFKEERSDIEKRIAYMKLECETHPERTATLLPQLEAMTRSLNKKRAGTFMPVFIGWHIRRDLGAVGKIIDTTWMLYYEFLGNKRTTPQVTTIAIDDVVFYVLRSSYILLAKKPVKMMVKPISLDAIYKEHEEIRRQEMMKFAKDAGEVVRIAPGLISSNKEALN